MPLVFPTPFPNDNAKDPIEAYRFGRAFWQRGQKFRAGQFTWSSTIPAATVRDVTFTDVTAGGSDTGVDNTVVGMYVTVTPPVGTSPLLQIDGASVATAGTLTVQIRNETAAPIAVAGTWSYLGYTY